MRQVVWSLLLIAAFAGLVYVAANDKGGQDDGKTIKIVSSLPRTGSAKAQTDTIVNGIKMALEEVDFKIGGFKIEYLDWDDATAAAGQWTSEQEKANAERAVKTPDVMVYIGPYNSGAAKASMATLNRASLLMISPANTWPGLTKKGKWDPGEPMVYRPTGKVNYTRVVPADDLQGPLGAKWAKEDLGVKSVYILDDNELYGKGIANLFEKKCEEIGIKVLGRDSIDAKAQEYKALMTKIGSLKPDLLYFGGTTQSNGGQVARDMIAAGLTCNMMVPDGCMEDAFIGSAGKDNIEGRVFVTFGGSSVDELVKGPGKAFVTNYEKKYGRLPEAYSIYGYEAGKVAVEAIRRAGKRDRQAIVDGALSIRNFDGATGRWSFDENGDTTSTTMSGSVVKNGDFKFVKELK